MTKYSYVLSEDKKSIFFTSVEELRASVFRIMIVREPECKNFLSLFLFDNKQEFIMPTSSEEGLTVKIDNKALRMLKALGHLVGHEKLLNRVINELGYNTPREKLFDAILPELIADRIARKES